MDEVCPASDLSDAPAPFASFLGWRSTDGSVFFFSSVFPNAAEPGRARSFAIEFERSPASPKWRSWRRSRGRRAVLGDAPVLNPRSSRESRCISFAVPGLPTG